MEVFIDTINRLKDRKIVCWGLGKVFYNQVLPFLEKNSLLDNVVGYVDISEEIREKGSIDSLNSKKILSPSQFLDLYKNTVLIISISDYRKIVEWLENNGADDIEWYVGKYLYCMYSDLERLSGKKPPKEYKKNGYQVIPKVINTFWFSDDSIPDSYQKCLNSWKDKCPDYDIRIWSRIDYNSGDCKYYEDAIKNKKWAFASDYARVDVISKYGGIYLDMDVEVIRNIDDLLLNDAYMGFGGIDYIECGSGFGAAPNNSIMIEICEDYKKSSFQNQDGTLDLTTAPRKYTKTLLKHGLKLNGSFQVVDNITVYPFESLTAKSFDTGQYYINENTYTVHHYNGNWLSLQSVGIRNNRYNDIRSLNGYCSFEKQE